MSTTSEPPTRREPSISADIGAVLAAGKRPDRASALSACLAFGWRGMLKIKHVPEQLIDVTITPVLFLLMFTYLFGGAISGSTGSYLDYIFPGILVQSVLFTAVYSGVALNADATKGVVDRFRSLPIWAPAPLAGAVIGDAVRFVLAAAILVALGLVMGYDATGGLAGMVPAVALVVVFTFGLSWVFTTAGMVMRSPNAVMNTGFMVLFPLVFLSNIFVEPSTLPSGLETFVNLNPVSTLTTATRGLMEGNSQPDDILISLGVAAAMTVVFAPLTVHLYRGKG